MEFDKVYHGDNLEILRTFPSDTFNLIYLDPPYRMGKTMKKGEWSFDDNMCLDDYLNFLRARLFQLKRVLRNDGLIYIHLDYRSVHYVKVMCDEIFDESNFINEIIWCLDGPYQSRAFRKKHENILLYSKSKDFVFYRDNVRIPYQRKFSDSYLGGMMTLNSGSVITKEKYNLGKIPTTWWDDCCKSPSNFAIEIIDYPTQKPMKLLERIVASGTQEFDNVLDPFCGSGTALVAANKLDCYWVGIDKNDVSELVAKRIERGY